MKRLLTVLVALALVMAPCAVSVAAAGLAGAGAPHDGVHMPDAAGAGPYHPCSHADTPADHEDGCSLDCQNWQQVRAAIVAPADHSDALPLDAQPAPHWLAGTRAFDDSRFALRRPAPGCEFAVRWPAQPGPLTISARLRI